MLKILCVVDKEATALDRLAKGVAKYHDNLDYKVLAVHPKRPDPQQLADFEREARGADVIDWQYYRTAEMLRAKYDWLASKKQILTHNNPYSITESDWDNYDINVGNNNYIYEQLKHITAKPVEYIPLTVDSDFWLFNTQWGYDGRTNHGNYDWKGNEDKPTVIMVANRIEAKKGILQVAIACTELNLRFVLVGSISDFNYFNSIAATGNLEFYEQISDKKLRDLYYKSILHVCNSVDNFESGTLPILEAMFCGVPVLTRKVGHVPDLYNGENMAILDGQPEDVAGIQSKLMELISDKKKLMELRDKAWNSVKSRNFERRAYAYQKLYRQVLYPDQLPVSVIVPIYDKPDITRKCLNAIAEQTYKNIEVIVADDNPIPNAAAIHDFANYVNFPVHYLYTAKKRDDYGLARARNEATIEATGEVIVYCDQRMAMAPNAVEEFVKALQPKTWLYGDKGGRKEFVENFSCIKREDAINWGLFNERINRYGGLSQETRNRFRNQGGRTEFVGSAKATPTGKSSNRNRKRQDIIAMKNRLWKCGLE